MVSLYSAGEKRCLLEAIEKYGSINQAAKESHMSFRKAWSCLKCYGRKARCEAYRTADRRTRWRRYSSYKKRKDNPEEIQEHGESLQKIVDGRFQKIFLKNDCRGDYMCDPFMKLTILEQRKYPLRRV